MTAQDHAAAPRRENAPDLETRCTSRVASGERCTLRVGHAGAHFGGNDSEWSDAEAALSPAVPTRYVVFLSSFLSVRPQTYHVYGDLRGNGTGLWTRCGRRANDGVMADLAVARKIGKPCKTCLGKGAAA